MRCECDVNAVWILCECQSFFCSSCRFVWGILCRWEDEESKRGRDKKTKRLREEERKGQRDEGTKRGRDKERKSQRVKETKGQRVKETKGRRVKETKSQRDKGSKRRREEETKGREDENRVTSYSPPIHLLFVSSSPPLHRLFTAQFVQILFNSCPKTFARFVSKTVLRQGTPLRESSVKVNVGGKVGVGGTGKEKAQWE